jgi:2-oxoglutarate dehydrogenase E2 component (dihydrolipoamide succinyltransferase)
MPVEVKIPSAGESISEVRIAEWLKSEGDEVELDEPIVEVESDKASLELPAPASGVLSKILKKNGESCGVGDVIAVIEERTEARKGGGEKPSATRTQAKEEHAAGEAEGSELELQAPAQTPPAKMGRDEPIVMPAAGRLQTEHELKSKEVTATGPGGRLLKEDVQAHLVRRGEGRPSESRTAAPQRSREEEAVPMTMLRRRIAERLTEGQRTAVALTTFNEIDMSSVMTTRREYQDAFLERYGVKLGIMSFFVKGVIDALKQFPQLNAEIRGTDIVYRNYYDIGVAVSTDRGLVVPVLRDAEHLSFAEVEMGIADFAERAHDKKLAPEELQGGTFTISNGGVFGSLLSTPLLNPPQSGILGLHAIQDRPVSRGGQVVVRPMMYVALTYDHRIVDGRESVTFLNRVKGCLENPVRVLIEA